MFARIRSLQAMGNLQATGTSARIHSHFRAVSTNMGRYAHTPYATDTGRHFYLLIH